MRRRVELIQPQRLLNLVTREVVLSRVGVQGSKRDVRRRQIGRQRKSSQRRFACRVDVLRFAQLDELEEVGTPEIDEGGGKPGVLRDDLLEQRNRRFES